MAEYIMNTPPKRSAWQRFKGYFNSPSSAGMVFVDRGSANVTRGSREIISLYHQSPWLRAVVTKIAQHYASVPWSLYQVNPAAAKADRRRLLKHLKTQDRFARKSTVTKALKGGDIVEVDDHPLLTMWEKGNRVFGGHKVRELSCKYYDTVGEVPWIVERAANGKPCEIWPIPATWIKTLPEQAGQSYTVQWGKDSRVIAWKDIIWLRDENLTNPYGRGIGIAHSLSDELDADEYASQLIKTAFENRGLLDVVVSIEGAKPEQLERAKAEFQNRHGGWLKAGVPFFHSGKADVKVVSQSFSELQLLQLREWERDTIISIYGVPPELLGVLGKSNRATILESREIMASEVLIPRLEYLKNVVNHTIVPEFGDDLFLDYEDPTPGNAEFQLRAMQANPASVTVREWREVQGLEDRGERDEYVLLPMNLTPFRGSYGVNDETPPEPAETAPETDTASDIGGGTANDEDKDQKDFRSASVKALDTKDAVKVVTDAVTVAPFETLVVPVMKRGMEAAAKAEMTDIGNLGKDVSGLDILDSVTTFLREFSATRIKDLINKTTQEQLRATLAEGMDAGEDYKRLSDRVSDVFEVTGNRAEVIARTEVMRASNYAQYLAQDASGLVEGREWIATRDGRERDSHGAMDGTIAPMGEKFALTQGENAGATAWHPGDFNIPGEDIQCFIPDTKVSGNFIGGVQSFYSGEIVEIQTSSGRKLTVTPNHPILTSTGFIAARFLSKGDNVVSYGVKINEALPSSDSNDIPITIEQVFGTLTSFFTPTAMRLRPVDLHGDAALMQGNVDVVRTNSELRLDISDSATQKNLSQFRLVYSNPRGIYLSGISDFTQVIKGSSATSNSIPSTSALALNSRSASFDSLPFQVFSFGSSSDCDTKFLKSIQKTGTCNASFVTDLLERNSTLITFDKVTKVRNISYTGHVYDLQSVSGLMVAEGIVVSNCRCTTAAVVESVKTMTTRTDAERNTIWKAFDDRLVKWEKDAVPAIKRAFEDQKTAVLKALDKVR